MDYRYKANAVRILLVMTDKLDSKLLVVVLLEYIDLLQLSGESYLLDEPKL